jgi:hypothetical protein
MVCERAPPSDQSTNTNDDCDAGAVITCDEPRGTERVNGAVCDELSMVSERPGGADASVTST